jgi:hypothetical protein
VNIDVGHCGCLEELHAELSCEQLSLFIGYGLYGQTDGVHRDKEGNNNAINKCGIKVDGILVEVEKDNVTYAYVSLLRAA